MRDGPAGAAMTGVFTMHALRVTGLLSLAGLLWSVPAAAQSIGSAEIIDGSIQAIDIAPETITTGRIKNETIQAIDLAPESITTGRILNRTIKAIDIATESITTAEIKNGTIDAIDLAAETITTGRIKNETIQAIDIAPESITTGRILNRTIKAIDIATESITTGEIKNGTVAGVDLAPGVLPPTYSLLDNDSAIVATFNHPANGFATDLSSVSFYLDYDGFPKILAAIAYVDNGNAEPSDDFTEFQRTDVEVFWTGDNCTGESFVDVGSSTPLFFGFYRRAIVRGDPGNGQPRALYVVNTDSTQNIVAESRNAGLGAVFLCNDLAAVAKMGVLPLTLVDSNLHATFPPPYTMVQN
jgi:hypothetical protein